jgi:hypothetical protein
MLQLEPGLKKPPNRWPKFRNRFLPVPLKSLLSAAFNPMKKKSTSQSAFFNLRVLIASVFCLIGVFFALTGAGLYLGSSKAQAQPGPGSAAPAANPANGPDVVQLVGPVRLDRDLRSLPYIPPSPHILKKRLTPPFRLSGGPAKSETPAFSQFQSVLEKIFRPLPAMPPPLLTFDGINFVQARIREGPPDTNGDVGPNHYVQSVNDSFRVFDKSGNPLTGSITFNMFFADLTGTPCGGGMMGHNEGDPFVFYDQLADRWVITDFAHPSDNGPFYECIGVSQTPDPTGLYFLYALQTDPANPDRFGDYPKFGLWPDAYYLTMNEFTDPNDPSTFVGVRVYALDRASMIGGGPNHAVGFTIPYPDGLGPSYSLVAASFRTGNPPPAGEQEFLLDIDASCCGVTLTQVKGWLFHVDFAVPANSTLGIGPNHAPNALITVNGFIRASTGDPDHIESDLVPQQGTEELLDTVGDKIMTPVVYQNRNGTESLWADHTIILNYPDGPTAVRWYQFNVTGGNFPPHPSATARLEQRQRRLMALDAQHSCRCTRKRGYRLFRVQPIHLPCHSLCRTSYL